MIFFSMSGKSRLLKYWNLSRYFTYIATFSGTLQSVNLQTPPPRIVMGTCRPTNTCNPAIPGNSTVVSINQLGPVAGFLEDDKLPGYMCGDYFINHYKEIPIKQAFLCVFFVAWPCVVLCFSYRPYQDLIDMKLQNDGISKDSETPAGSWHEGPLGKGDPYLGGGLNEFLFSPLFGEDFRFD